MRKDSESGFATGLETAPDNRTETSFTNAPEQKLRVLSQTLASWFGLFARERSLTPRRCLAATVKCAFPAAADDSARTARIGERSRSRR